MYSKGISQWQLYTAFHIRALNEYLHHLANQQIHTDKIRFTFISNQLHVSVASAATLFRALYKKIDEI